MKINDGNILNPAKFDEYNLLVFSLFSTILFSKRSFFNINMNFEIVENSVETV